MIRFRFNSVVFILLTINYPFVNRKFLRRLREVQSLPPKRTERNYYWDAIFMVTILKPRQDQLSIKMKMGWREEERYSTSSQLLASLNFHLNIRLFNPSREERKKRKYIKINCKENTFNNQRKTKQICSNKMHQYKIKDQKSLINVHWCQLLRLGINQVFIMNPECVRLQIIFQKWLLERNTELQTKKCSK